MRKILLASHGRLASGLKDTLEFFLGKSEMIVAVNAYVDASDDYIKEIQKMIDEAVEGEFVIFTDIYGGSVHQQVTVMVTESKKRLPIVTGMNLPLVLSAALADEALTVQLMERLLRECMPQLSMPTENMTKEGDLDDFLE